MKLHNIPIKLSECVFRPHQKEGNETHHLYKNHCLFWIKFTLKGPTKSYGVWESLGTSDINEAMKRRDQLFDRLRIICRR